MTRGQFQRAVWLALRDLNADRHPMARNVVDNILDAADAYSASREHYRAAVRLTAMQRDQSERQAERRAVIEELVSASYVNAGRRDGIRDTRGRFGKKPASQQVEERERRSA